MSDTISCCEELESISQDVSNDPSETILKMLGPIATLEKYVREGGIIGSSAYSPERAQVERAIERTDPFYHDFDESVRNRICSIYDRLDNIKEASRKNEGGDGWLSSDCYGREYDNWLSSGC